MDGRKRDIRGLGALLGLAALALCVWPSGLRADDDLYRQLKPLMESMAIIQDNYVDADKVTSAKLVSGAIKGMMEQLDPFSEYMDPDATKDMNSETEGSFGGLGIEISQSDKMLTVISPIDGTPADKAGIKAGDVILKIDGASTEGMDLTDAVHKMRGEPGSKVTISIFRTGFDAPKDINLVRAVIKMQTVKSYMLGDKVGYIRLSEFMGTCAEDFGAALDKLRDQGARALIIDVRNNPGGKLNSAAAIASHFVERGKVIVSTASRYKDKDMSFASDGGDRWTKPTVILINGGSASASEILAGALQDYGLAVVVGTKSFGKGSVQTILQLSNGGSLRLTTAKYLTPNGRSLHGTGIDPDVLCEEEPVSKVMAGLEEQGSFAAFVKFYRVEHPSFTLKEAGPKTPIKVSEHDWQVLKPESKEDILLDDFQAYLDKHGKRLDPDDLARERTHLLAGINEELARQTGGEDAARIQALSDDPQVGEALNVLSVERILASRSGSR
ncbi:MAG TPA: S41 family peptidase [bacterium]|jgi:carboxyl-terminal processing protease|nr:S41 family peptidase [bacterium]